MGMCAGGKNTAGPGRGGQPPSWHICISGGGGGAAAYRHPSRDQQWRVLVPRGIVVCPREHCRGGASAGIPGCRIGSCGITVVRCPYCSSGCSCRIRYRRSRFENGLRCGRGCMRGGRLGGRLPGRSGSGLRSRFNAGSRVCWGRPTPPNFISVCCRDAYNWFLLHHRFLFHPRRSIHRVLNVVLVFLAAFRCQGPRESPCLRATHIPVGWMRGHAIGSLIFAHAAVGRRASSIGG